MVLLENMIEHQVDSKYPNIDTRTDCINTVKMQVPQMSFVFVTGCDHWIGSGDPGFLMSENQMFSIRHHLKSAKNNDYNS